jgi:hypothetical protein
MLGVGSAFTATAYADDVPEQLDDATVSVTLTVAFTLPNCTVTTLDEPPDTMLVPVPITLQL